MKGILLTVLVVCLVGLSEASQCCKSYTDIAGNYHDPVLCADYCCGSITSALTGLSCCSDPSLASDSNVDDECESWIEDHIWVPIVAGVVFLIIVIACCTCCCCCGFCCCRKDGGTVIVSQPAPLQSVVMSSQTSTAVNNPVHYGYDQN